MRDFTRKPSGENRDPPLSKNISTTGYNKIVLRESKCIFASNEPIEYFNGVTGTYGKYSCDELAVKDGLCLFHHPTLVHENPDLVRSTFLKKLERDLGDDSKEVLLYIGYNIPEIDLSNLHFTKPVFFDNSIFLGPVNFEGAVFESEASFKGADFRKGARFYSAEFKHLAVFDNVEFEGYANFAKSKFTGPRALFRNTKFEMGGDFHGIEAKEITFSNGAFLKSADISYSKIGSACFGGAIFLQNASFSHSSFERLNCRNTTFERKLIITKTDVSKSSLFSGSCFLSEVRFDESNFDSLHLDKSEFKGHLVLQGSKFRGLFNISGARVRDLSIHNSIFEGWVKAQGMQIGGRVEIGNSVFKSDALFSDSRFLGTVSIHTTEFSDVSFDRSEFSDIGFSLVKFQGASFYKTTFSGQCIFHRPLFTEYADFREAKFKSNTYFLQLIFLPCLLYLEIPRSLNFRGTYFEEEGKLVTFDGGLFTDRILLLGSNFSRIRFQNVEWPEVDGSYRIYEHELLLLSSDSKYRRKYYKKAVKSLKEVLENDELIESLKSALQISDSNFSEFLERIQDDLDEYENFDKWEKILMERLSHDSIGIDDVLAIYRTLRDNYDFYLKYEGSGKFFVGEMDLLRDRLGRMDRKNRGSVPRLSLWSSSHFNRTIMWFYKVLCLYGESYSRPALWLILTIILFALYRTIIESIPLIMRHEIHALIPKLMGYLTHSVAVFFQLVNEIKPDILLERLIAVPILGSLYLALKRRLERRIRH